MADDQDLSKKSFLLEEYKALRIKIQNKVQERISLARYGLTGIGAIYGAIFTKLITDTPWWLWWIPFLMSGYIAWHQRIERRVLEYLSSYINQRIENEILGQEGGWESFLRHSSRLSFSDEPFTAPYTLWYVVSAITLLVAVSQTFPTAIKFFIETIRFFTKWIVF